MTKLISNLRTNSPPETAVAVTRVCFGGEPGGYLSVDYQQSPVSSWPSLLWRAKKDFHVEHGPDGKRGYISWSRSGEAAALLCVRHVESWTPRSLLAELCRIPFLTADIRAWFNDWKRLPWERDDPMYIPDAGFGMGHNDHGFAVLFQGAGHDQVVSRRYLEHGPWLTRYGPNDTTMVQFFDERVDSKTAITQARPGHAYMGWSSPDLGGFFHVDVRWKDEAEVKYDPARKMLLAIVVDREPPPWELRAFRHLAISLRADPHRPVERCAYVFLDPAVGRRLVPALWIRGIETWVVDGDKELRVDEDFVPHFPKPAWVQTVLDREAQ